MRFADVLREALRALRGSPSRTLLTGIGVTVGTMALALILSLSLGLENVLDDLVASDEQLRHVVVLPGYGRQASDGFSTPEVDGEMDAAKRQRLQRALLKRSRGGPSFQIRPRVIDPETEASLARLDGVASVRAFLQDRFEVTLLGETAETAREPAAALSLGVPASHPIYASRLVAGRWFAYDDEPGVVLHEVLLWKMGFTSDEAQTALVGRPVRLVARKSAPGVAAMFFGGAAAPAGAAVAFEVETRIVGVMRERFGAERAVFVDEAWAMQTDLFLSQGWARTLWDRQEGRAGPPAVLLTAKGLDEVERIETALREQGLEVRTVREAVDGLKRGLSIVTVVASVLAAIALFVSALGIVNTLVMSVLERTREIGLLKALGATDGDVARIFVVEAGLLGLGGGVVGTALGFALSLLGDEIGRRKVEELFLMPFAGSLFRFPWTLAAGSLAFAVVTSLLASIAPTLRASRVDPVRALRHE